MKGRYITRALDPQDVAKLLDEVSPLASGGAPRAVMGWFQGGQLRRVRADYPNGWRLQFSISTQGNVSRLQATMRLVQKRSVPA